MKSFLIVSSLLVLCLALSGCGNGGEEGEIGGTEGTQAGQAGTQAGQYEQPAEQPVQQPAMQPVPFEQRQEWMSTAEASFQQTTQQLEQLDQQVMQLPPEAQQEYLGEVNELKQTRADLQQQWAELQAATAEDWNDKHSGFHNKFQQYQQDLMELQTKLAGGGQTTGGGTGM